tara:strand:- start:8726 stop:9271 length:546 start_codon:yes stop_codon:yes gene_type:complete
MKKVVWSNKSNGQLCVTIPKNSGIKEGDIVSLEKEKIKTIVYTPVILDLFHYGQLQLLEKANELGDFHICAIVTDDAIKKYKEEPVANYKERAAIASSLRCVDMVMAQHSQDPTENLKEISKQFKGAKIIMVYGSNWEKTAGSAYIKKIGGEIVQPEFYKKLSTENIVKKIAKIHGVKKLK